MSIIKLLLLNLRKSLNLKLVFLCRFLHIPLMDAERAWSYAMELKLLANTEPRKRFHLVRRLRKAAHYAGELETLCQSEKCDARTKLEAQVRLIIDSHTCRSQVTCI